MVPIGTSLLLGERVVSGMSLGKKNSMYESFKRASGTQFCGFHAAAQLHCLCKYKYLCLKMVFIHGKMHV